MKVFLALCLCGWSIALPAQTKLQTFTSADGMFQFKHSNLLVHCTEQRHEEGNAGVWVPADSCEAFTPDRAVSLSFPAPARGRIRLAHANSYAPRANFGLFRARTAFTVW